MLLRRLQDGNNENGNIFQSIEGRCSTTKAEKFITYISGCYSLKTVNRVCLLRKCFSFVLLPEKEASVSEYPFRRTGIKVAHKPISFKLYFRHVIIVSDMKRIPYLINDLQKV